MQHQDLFELVNQNCTLGAVQDLLREFKLAQPKEKKSEILVSGESKASVIETNLKGAVTGGIIPIKRVFGLLQDGEENGSQHIFYFRPVNDEARGRGRDFEEIGKTLWGAKWKQTQGFPKLDLKPQSYAWSDFRLGVREKAKDWVAKLYGHETLVRFNGEERIDETNFIRKYEKYDARTVLLIRWHNDGILEIRVSSAGTRKDQLLRLNSAWQQIGRALPERLFKPWNLSGVNRELIRLETETAAKNEKIKDEAKKSKTEPKTIELDYETGEKEFLDEESWRTTIRNPVQSDEEAGTAGKSTTAAVKSHVDNENSDCCRLIVYWKPNEQNGLARNLRIQLGTIDHPNELIIGSQIDPKSIDYVTNQLRQFDK